MRFDHFKLLILEGPYDRERAMQRVWNLVKSVPDAQSEIEKAADLLDKIDAPEPEKYIRKKVNPNYDPKDKNSKQFIRDRGSKTISSEWEDWNSNRSTDEDSDRNAAQQAIENAVQSLRDRIATAKDDPEDDYHFDKADEEWFGNNEKRDKDADSYYGQLEANVGAVLSSVRDRSTRTGIRNGWEMQDPQGTASFELTDRAKRGGAEPSQAPQGRTSKTSKSDLVIAGPNGETINISAKQGSNTFYSASEPGTQRGLADVAATELARKENQFNKPRKEKGDSDEEYKEKVARAKEANDEKIAARRQELLDKSARVSDALDQRPVSAAGKAAANTAQRELEDDEPEFSRRIGSEAASGKGTIKDKRGVAQKIIKSKGVEPERKRGADNPNYGRPIERDEEGTKDPNKVKATYAARSGRSSTRPGIMAARDQGEKLKTGDQQQPDQQQQQRQQRMLQIRKEIERRKKSGQRTGPHFTNNQMGNGLPEDKYLKLSQGMKTFSEFVLECSQLDEGGLSRLVGQAKKKGVAVLSGTRGDKSSKENKARNQQLVKDIRGKGLPGPTKAKGKWEGGSERSHIVTSGKQGKRAFKDKVKSLGVKYDQDAVITQSPGKSATLTRTSKDGMDKKRRSIGKMRPGKSNPKNETQIKGKTFTYEK